MEGARCCCRPSINALCSANALYCVVYVLMRQEGGKASAHPTPQLLMQPCMQSLSRCMMSLATKHVSSQMSSNEVHPQQRTFQCVGAVLCCAVLCCAVLCCVCCAGWPQAWRWQVHLEQWCILSG
jgi:hypothetical protein